MTALAPALDVAAADRRHGVGGLVGTGVLVRLALRRDRVALPVWVLGTSALAASFASMTTSAFDSPEQLATESALMISTPAVRMTGLMSGGTVGGYAMARGYLTLAVLAALMSAVAVVRHTRQDEETGRAELLGATVVGRYASLTAAVAVTVAANLALVPLLALANVVGGLPVGGAWVAGVAVAVVGLAFTGVAAVTVQLSPSARAASGLAGAVLGLAFVLSGVGNVLGEADAAGTGLTPAWPSWLSPIGWGQQMRAFDRDLWWPALLAAAFLAALLALAARLVARRDVGRGLLAERRGRATASPRLAGPFALALRLQRPVLVAWGVAMAAFGLVFGSLGDQVAQGEDASQDWFREMGGTDRIAAAFTASMLLMGGMAVAGFVVQVVLRMRAEEADGRVEAVLATAVARVRWARAHVLVAALGCAGLMVVFGLAMGVSGASSVAGVGELCLAALVHGVGALALGGAVVAAAGLAPRWAAAVGWGGLLVAVLFGPLFGPGLGVPAALQDLSPFTSVPMVPAVDLGTWDVGGPVLALASAAVGLVVAGLVGLRRRDLRLPS